MAINIETKRLTLRQLSNEDWILYHELQTNPEIIALCFDERSENDIKAGFESRLPNWAADSEHWLCLVITEKESGNKVGITGFNLADGVAEIGYLLLPCFHDQGYATESLKALLAWSKNIDEINSFNAIVTKGNIGSERVLEKCGFILSRIEKNAYEIRGQLYDDHIYTL
ncbi:GNAT family N-acetyltransferase [Photobacterium angustum]|uniref:Putative acetyltransferase n=1 Tax=Photobacterium angustum (strain S14 / CCUG 15956) TaxID=314292 RepID=Q1ZUX2_PHOAS|nr:GNAT family N-acetyltransferase [Photobacterium angustum]EAS66288.1 putative acetyltransferase [Photobacterium angustum S14]